MQFPSTLLFIVALACSNNVSAFSYQQKPVIKVNADDKGINGSLSLGQDIGAGFGFTKEGGGFQAGVKNVFGIGGGINKDGSGGVGINLGDDNDGVKIQVQFDNNSFNVTKNGEPVVFS